MFAHSSCRRPESQNTRHFWRRRSNLLGLRREKVWKQSKLSFEKQKTKQIRNKVGPINQINKHIQKWQVWVITNLPSHSMNFNHWHDHNKFSAHLHWLVFLIVPRLWRNGMLFIVAWMHFLKQDTSAEQYCENLFTHDSRDRQLGKLKTRVRRLLRVSYTRFSPFDEALSAEAHLDLRWLFVKVSTNGSNPLVYLHSWVIASLLFLHFSFSSDLTDSLVWLLSDL